MIVSVLLLLGLMLNFHNQRLMAQTLMVEHVIIHLEWELMNMMLSWHSRTLVKRWL